MIYIYHAYRSKFEKNLDIFIKNENIVINVSKDLTLLSIMNEECFNNSYLVKQCKNNSINLIVPKSTFNIKKDEWKNPLKISAIVEALEKIDTEYVLILDGKDTCILNDLDNNFLNKFKEFNCDILFNCQETPFPLNQIKGENDFLNAGVCIGKKIHLLKFYTECLNHIEDVFLLKDGKPSEQYIIKKVVGYIDLKVKVDIENKLFTCYSNNIREVADNL